MDNQIFKRFGKSVIFLNDVSELERLAPLLGDDERLLDKLAQCIEAWKFPLYFSVDYFDDICYMPEFYNDYGVKKPGLDYYLRYKDGYVDLGNFETVLSVFGICDCSTVQSCDHSIM